MAKGRSREARARAAAKESAGVDPLVAQFRKSKKQRALERAGRRKEREQKGRAALERLAEQRETVDQLADLKQRRRAEHNVDRESRKRKTESERWEARRKRRLVQNEQNRALLNYQSVLQERHAEREEKAAAARVEISAAAQRRFEEEDREWFAKRARGEETAPCRTHYVRVERPAEVEQARRQLPMLMVEQEVMEAVDGLTTNALVLCGATGSGKTTQLPQFLWEAGYGSSRPGYGGMIAVTQPRRVAARAMAERVASELCVEFGAEVSYQVRYDHNLSQQTKVKFLTEGILLRELQDDILLRRYSVVVLDEAHERGISTDLLLGMLTRVVRLRWEMNQERRHRGQAAPDVFPLKLIIMSATLEVESLRSNSRLFPVPPRVIQVDARQFPVSKHFARQTNVGDYVGEAVHKVKQLHQRLPPGGVLVFLPTQRTIHQCCSALRRHFARHRVRYSESNWQKPKDDRDKTTKALDAMEDLAEAKGVDEWGLKIDDYELEDLADDSAASERPKMQDDFQEAIEPDSDSEGDAPAAAAGQPGEGAAGAEEEGEEEEEEEEEEGEEGEEAAAAEEGELDTLHVLPLYALMNPAQQQRVFGPVPQGKRLCVVATNVAETSLTLPGIRYVIDSGRAKMRKYDPATGVARFDVGWVPKASAEQRAGRAGRVGPGHAYRLFSTAVYANQMPDHAIPEILQSPLESLVLFIKGFWDRSVLAFPFPTPPPTAGVEASLVHLARIGALVDRRAKGQYAICPLGRAIGHLPLLPRYGKMLVLAKALWEGDAAGAERRSWLRGLTAPALPAAACGRILASTVGVVAIASSMLDVFMPPPSEDPEALKGFREVVRKYRCPGSDYLTALRVLIDFIKYRGNPQDFCDSNFLIYRGMRDAVGLRRQLVQLLASGEDTADVFAALADEEEVTARRSGERLLQQQRLSSALGRNDMPRSADEEIVLRKLIASGLVDQIARRAAPHECEQRRPPIPYDDSSARRAPYVQPLTGDILHVHPLSSVAAQSPPPDFVVFTRLQAQRHQRRPQEAQQQQQRRPSKVYMKGVTAVRREWLADLGWEDTG